jgi:DNA-binding Xre family transcriptional regulator
MERGESGGSDDNIVIVKVTGKTSKTITIPDTVCEFLDIDFGDILKLRIQDKRKGKSKRK